MPRCSWLNLECCTKKGGGFMTNKNTKTLKKIGIIIVSIIALFYSIFLLVLPNIINLNNYKKDIQKIVKEGSNLNIDFENAKIVTSPLLSIGAKLTGLKISYPDNTTLISTDKAEAKIAILPLALKTLKVSSIKIDAPEITLDIMSDDRFKLEKFITEYLKTQAQKPQAETATPADLKLQIPSIKISDYKITMRDVKTSDTLVIGGEKLLLADIDLSKRARIITQGHVLLNNKENISYDVNIDTFLPDLTQMQKQEVQPTQTTFAFNPVKVFKTYNLKANLSTKLKIRDKNGVNVNGFLNAENISLSLPNKTLPDSYLKLKFKGQKVNVDSDINVAQNENANIFGEISYGKKQAVNLNVHTDKLSMQNLQDITSGLLDSLFIKNDMSKIKAQGYLKADFELKTNLKTIKSNGTLDVINASFVHKTIPAAIKNLNVNIDFSGDKINIKKFQAYLNGSLFEVLGHIDTQSNADIKLVTKNLQIANFYSAFAPKSITQNLIIKNGSLHLNAIIKGRLDKIKPEINLNLANLAMIEKTNNLNISGKNILVNLIVSQKGYNGTITQSETSVSMPNLILHNPSQKAIFNDKDIQIVPSTLYINSSPIKYSGEIKDYLKKCDININANGSLKTSDIARILPKNTKQLISYSGSLPFKLNLNGNAKKMFINGKIQANSSNHFSPITINKLLNKPSFVNILTELSPNKLIIKDLGIYDSNSAEVIKMTGSISDLEKKIQKIDGLKLNLPSGLKMSTQALKNSSFNVQGNLNISGTTLSPVLKGNINISDVMLSDFMTKIQSVIISMHGNSINTKINSANINGSVFNINADAKLTTPILTITKMTLSSSFVDADRLFIAMDKIAKLTAPSSSSSGSSASNADIPVKILSGQAKIDRLKMGQIVATNISGNYNLYHNILKIPTLSVVAYDGLITGSAAYNLLSTATTANVKGSGIDVNPAISAAALIKNQLFGTAKFKADVSFKGVTYEQQMKSLNGTVKFNIGDGQFGSFGRFENFLKAPNLLSQSFIRTSIGSIINTVAPYNTANFKYLKGHITLANGIANIKAIKSSGSNMSLYITGDLNLLNNYANMTILGRISSQVVGVLGPLSQLTTDKITKYIPAYGLQALSIFRSLTDKSSQVDLNNIPELTPTASNSQEFKVNLQGNIANPLSVKSFKWLSTASEMEKTQTSLNDFLKAKYGTNIVIPRNRKEVIQTVIQTKQVQDKIQQLQENENVQKLKMFGDIIKQYSQ